MAKIAGRQVEIGLGIEATPGTAVAATDFLKWDSFSIQSMADKIMFNSARGIRNKISNSVINRKYGKGNLEFVPTVIDMPYIFGLAMGTRTTTTNADASGNVYDHTYTIQNANASMKTATILVKQGGIQTERYANCVAESMELSFDKDFAKCKVGIVAAFPDTSSASPSYTKDTVFTRNDISAKFGTSLSAAASASVTPLVNFSLSLSNNVLFDEAFLSGSNQPVAGGFVAGALAIKGSYTIQFSDTTELAKYQANTLNALIVTATGAAIGTSANELIVLKIGRMVLTKAPLEYTIDGLVHVKQEFEVQYDATDKELTCVVTNLNAGTNY